MANILERIRERSTVPIFIYGTLRQGAIRHSWVQHDMVSRHDGKVEGYDLYMNASFDYPAMSKSRNGSHVVHGDLVWLRVNNNFMDLVNMELEAGFQLNLVEVVIPQLAEPVLALCFAYPRKPRHDWTRVNSGDWLLT
jgi:hypothetical protein